MVTAIPRALSGLPAMASNTGCGRFSSCLTMMGWSGAEGRPRVWGSPRNPARQASSSSREGWASVSRTRDSRCPSITGTLAQFAMTLNGA